MGSVATGAFGTVPGLLLLPYLTDTLGVTALLAGLVVVLPGGVEHPRQRHVRRMEHCGGAHWLPPCGISGPGGVTTTLPPHLAPVRLAA